MKNKLNENNVKSIEKYKYIISIDVATGLNSDIGAICVINTDKDGQYHIEYNDTVIL